MNDIPTDNLEPIWYSMLSKFSGNCKECGEKYDEGDPILWCKGVGAKHQECPVHYNSDDSGIVIIDDDSPKVWKDPKKHIYKELQTMNECQCCGKDVSDKSQRYIDDDRLVCVRCFG